MFITIICIIFMIIVVLMLSYIIKDNRNRIENYIAEKDNLNERIETLEDLKDDYKEKIDNFIDEIKVGDFKITTETEATEPVINGYKTYQQYMYNLYIKYGDFIIYRKSTYSDKQLLNYIKEAIDMIVGVVNDYDKMYILYKDDIFMNGKIAYLISSDTRDKLIKSWKDSNNIKFYDCINKKEMYLEDISKFSIEEV